MNHEFTTNVEIHLDWKDKLRMLITGWLKITINHDCQNNPGKVDSSTKMRVIGPIESFKAPTLKGIVQKQEQPRDKISF